MSVEGFLRNNKYPEDFGVFQRSDGSPLKPEEALTFLHMEKAKGRKVIPCSGECGNPCKNADKGCAGFDYGGGAVTASANGCSTTCGTQYTRTFLWCCYALAWGIQRYDEAKQAAQMEGEQHAASV